MEKLERQTRELVLADILARKDSQIGLRDYEFLLKVIHIHLMDFEV